ncbi:MAG: SulP family inorganic anion transporter [Gammaproteobacteria bacterium]|nr:SulP family inorganic anion transporter [Pseudomonadales bacterium]MCP5346516.1 SulP family inorganic anion transporter [Pseudomonadales bacterium]
MYSRRAYTQNLSGNLFGGLTAAIVALPLALAFGISSGAGPVAGLYGAVCVGFFAAVFGGTPTQISGPTGPMTVVMAAMTADYLAGNPEQGLALAFSTVFLGGCLQALFGMLRIGKYIIMVPYPVISGFMTGIGVIIILMELGPLLGFPSNSDIAASVAALPAQLAGLNGYAIGAGAISLAVVFLWRGRLNRILPAPLVALIAATVTLSVFFPTDSIARIGTIPSAIPTLHLPVFQIDMLQSMLTNAVMLAVLGSIDSLLTSLVADNITDDSHDSDRELIGQGIGNAVAGLLGGLPGAGATMRTMVNIRAGGSGPLGGVVHSLILLATLSGLGFLFQSIPLAALAGILIKVGIDIIDWPFLKQLWKLPRFPVALMLVVLLLTVFVDLITAVFVGVFIKNLVTISKLSDLQLGSVILSDGVTDLDRLPPAEAGVLAEHTGEVLLLRITGPLSYAVGRGLSSRVKAKLNDSRLLVIDITAASIVGISTAMVLLDLVRKALARGIAVKFIGADLNRHQELAKLGLTGLIARENLIDRLDQAFV